MRPVVRVSTILLSVLTIIVWLLVLGQIPIQVGVLVIPPWAAILFGLALTACTVSLWSVSRKTRQQQLPTDQVTPTQEQMLEEYRLAQASAEHHDRLLWNTTGIVWGGSLVLLGLAFKELREIPEASPRVLVSLLGITLTSGVWWMTSVWNGVMRVKYARCQELERLLGFRQHLNVDAEYPHGRMSILYALISLILLGTWIAVLWIGPEATSP